MSVSNQCEKSARACSPNVLCRGTPRMLDLYKNSFWSGSLMRFSKTGNYVRCALSIGLTFMNNYCFLASVWAIQERDNLGCLFQSVTDTLAVHLWGWLRYSTSAEMAAVRYWAINSLFIGNLKRAFIGLRWSSYNFNTSFTFIILRCRKVTFPRKSA